MAISATLKVALTRIADVSRLCSRTGLESERVSILFRRVSDGGGYGSSRREDSVVLLPMRCGSGMGCYREALNSDRHRLLGGLVSRLE